MNKQNIAILFADDHALFREGMVEHLRRFYDGATIVEAGNLDEALARFDDAISIVLLDLQMPGMNGLEGFDRVKTKAGERPIIIVSGFTDKRTVNALLERGASGFIPKTASSK